MGGPRTGKPSDLGYVYPDRAHPEGKYLVQPALTRATALVGTVRDEDATAVARILDRLDRQQLYALVVVLAAMVPDDQPVHVLTDWVHDRVTADLLRAV